VLTDRSADEGSILVLVIGYTALAAILLIVGVDLSSVFLARRALSSTTDSAALAAAQGIDRSRLYDGPGLDCGESLPLARGRAVDLATAAVNDDRPGLRRTFRSVEAPQVTVAGGTVGVRVAGEVRMPFSRVVSWLDPASDDGAIRISATSHARSPVTGPAGC
jgi:hypothetical protein